MRKIIHIDMDAFYASVEQRDFPKYRAKPLIVGGLPDRRGVVAACSYEARRFGIHSAMSSSRAYRLCPDAIFVAPRFDVYRECSRQIQAIFHQYTELVEPLSLDEAFLDVSENDQYQGSATLIAQAIRTQIKNELELTASAGVSYNKFLAKIASDINKPDGLYVIEPAAAQTFLAQLPVRKFFGVGKATEAKMQSLGLFSGADISVWTQAQLETHFGKAGKFYYQIVRGIDERPVRPSRTRKSLGTETTFDQDLTSYDHAMSRLTGLADKLQGYLTDKSLQAHCITLKVKYGDFQQITRSKTTVDKIATAADCLKLIPELLQKTEVGQRPVRLLGISLSNFARRGTMAVDRAHDTRQLRLFNDRSTS